MTKLLRAVFTLLLLSILTACGGGGGSAGNTNGTPLFTTAADTVTILPGETRTYTIGGGVQAYSASSNSGAVVVTVDNKTLSITAMIGGSATVTVKDALGAKVTIEVTVGTGTKLFTTAADKITILPSETQTYSVSGGVPGYLASSNSAAVAVTLNGRTLTISGSVGGSATVTVTDASGAKVSIDVTVGTGAALYTTAAEKITISPGETQYYRIGGGVPGYSATSNSNSVSVLVTGTIMSVIGNGGGPAIITVKDAFGAKVSIDVTVGSGVALYSTAPTAVNVGVGATSSEYSIGGGSQIYAVASSNNAIATVTMTAGNRFVIKGVANGKATVVVRDSLGGLVSIDVTVGSSNALFTTAASDINIAVGASAVFTVGGGTQPYVVGTSDASVATATIAVDKLTISGNAIGASTIGVRDAAGASVNIKTTVGSVSALFTTAPAALTVAPGTSSQEFQIGGGSQVYSVSSSNVQVATVGINGNKFVVTGVATGSATILVKDSAGASVSLAVTVGASVAFYSTIPKDVTIAVAGTNSYVLGGGSAPYTATSANTSVATATVTGSSLAVTGMTPGKTTINLRDAAGATIDVNVTIGSGIPNSLYTTASGAITIGIGSAIAPSFTIGGGSAPYTVTSSNVSVATVALSGNTFTITGVAPGNAAIVVKDAVGASVVMNTTVASGSSIALYTTAPSAINIVKGAIPAYTIAGGTAPYTVTSSNVAVAKATLTSATTFTVEGVAAGVAKVLVRDATGTAVSIDVTVTAVQGVVLDILPSAATANVGDVLTLKVTGGVSPYAVTNSNSSVASLDTTNLAVNGTVAVTLLNNGSTVISVVDAAGTTKTVPITVNQANALLRLSPSAFMVGENNADVINLSVYGGVPPYRAFTSDLRKTNVSISGSTFIIALGTAGNRCINPVDTSGAYVVSGTYDVTLTVLDSKGASAVSVMTIKDNGMGLNVGCP